MSTTSSSVTEFFDTLESVGVLSAAQLHELRRGMSAAADSLSIAGELLKQGWLTAYQANHGLLKCSVGESMPPASGNTLQR